MLVLAAMIFRFYWLCLGLGMVKKQLDETRSWKGFMSDLDTDFNWKVRE